ncbi:hypothetical protein EDF71_103192 [Comamonas sp. JUb58]|nr:hypothetical protein EDF71_103192 [Comamonas sp. JUb58]
MSGQPQAGAVGMLPTARACRAPNRGGRCAAGYVLPAQATDMPVPCAASHPDRGLVLLSPTTPASAKGWPATVAGRPLLHPMLPFFVALRSHLLRWRNV